MTIGFAVFGAAFLIGLALGTYTRRPFITACFVTGCFAALVAGTATNETFPAVVAFGVVFLSGLVIDSVRETFSLLLGR
jgi:hypothetical protein